MRAIFILFLGFFYLVMSSGFTTYTHFCKGTQQAITVFNIDDSDSPCPFCTGKNKDLKKKKKGCCRYESKVLKTDDLTKNDYGFNFSVKFWGESIPSRNIGALFDASYAAKDLKKPKNLSSKITLQSNPLFIFHCTYRI